MSDQFGARGARLWASLHEQDGSLSDEHNPAREVAISACHTADRVDELEQECKHADPVIEGRSSLMTNPVFVEVRNQAALMARLIAALRLPDEKTGKRPQRRSGPHGTHASAGVSSIERARQTKTG